MKVLIFLLMHFIAQILYGQNFNCSAFSICTDGVFLAKNLDFELGTGIIVFNPRGIEKNSVMAENTKWVSGFSSLTFNMFGLNHPLGGMNEEGFVIEELSSFPVEYYNYGEKTVDELELIQYLLDNFSSVKEVERKINELGIMKLCFNLHYFLCDKSGECAVLEYLNGIPVFIKGEKLEYKVLTNNSYNELLKYKKLANGAVDRKLNNNSSQERFLKIVSILESDQIVGSKDQIQSSFKILDSVKVDDTQWSIVYNLEDRIIYFNTAKNRKIRQIDIKLFAKNNNYRYSDIDDGEYFGHFDTRINNLYLNKMIEDILLSAKFSDIDFVTRIKILKEE